MDYLIYGLADYVVNLSYEDLPARVVEAAKQVITDSYGNLIFGRYCETSDKILKYAKLSDTDMKNEKSASFIGEEEVFTDCETAVFAHTMMARCADLDDGYRHAMGHPGSGLVPLLLTMAQQYKKNGKEMITAIAAAYDIYARLGETVNPFMYRERGFDATGVCGAVAAAALVSKITGANAEKTKNAMGIASLFTGGLIEYQNDGTSGKIMCGGWAALSGIRAVRLAACGFTGPDAALEGKYGFLQAFKGTSGHCEMGRVLSDLGKDFKITEIYFKRHACQRGLHAVLDAVLDLRECYALTPALVKTIDIRTSSFVHRLSNPHPQTAVGAQASAQFTSAVALKYGRMDSEKLIFNSFNDNEIQSLVQRITVIKDETVEEYLANNPTHFCAAHVILETYSGNKYERWVPVPLGDMETPFGWDMLKVKFDHLVDGTPGEKSKAEKFGMLKNLENVSDISFVFQL